MTKFTLQHLRLHRPAYQSKLPVNTSRLTMRIWTTRETYSLHLNNSAVAAQECACGRAEVWSSQSEVWFPKTGVLLELISRMTQQDVATSSFFGFCFFLQVFNFCHMSPRRETLNSFGVKWRRETLNSFEGVVEFTFSASSSLRFRHR